MRSSSHGGEAGRTGGGILFRCCGDCFRCCGGRREAEGKRIGCQHETHERHERGGGAFVRQPVQPRMDTDGESEMRGGSVEEAELCVPRREAVGAPDRRRGAVEGRRGNGSGSTTKRTKGTKGEGGDVRGAAGSTTDGHGWRWMGNRKAKGGARRMWNCASHGARPWGRRMEGAGPWRGGRETDWVPPRNARKARKGRGGVREAAGLTTDGHGWGIGKARGGVGREWGVRGRGGIGFEGRRGGRSGRGRFCGRGGRGKGCRGCSRRRGGIRDGGGR